MATNAVVATGTIDGAVSSTCSLTVSGFGTPTAALLFISNANTTNNPQASLNFSVGIWSSGGSSSSTIYADDGESTETLTGRKQFNDYPLAQLRASANPGLTELHQTFTVSTTTDGLTLTVASSGSSATRYVYAILINGTSNVSHGSINLGTGTSAIDVTAPGFRPDLVFFHSTGNGNELDTVHAILSFGAAHNNGSTTNQGMVGLWSEGAQVDSDTGSYINSGYVAGQVFNGSTNWLASVSDFDANGFSITPSANAGSDIVYYLAIELADADDAYVGIIDSKTSTGTQAYTGTGFTPDVVGLVQTMCTATNTITEQGSLAFGATDGTRSRVLSIVDDDAQAVSDADSASYDGALWIRFDSGADDAKATISSLDSNGFTLDYSDGSASARKILAFAIGDSTASGGATDITVADSSHGHTADGLTLTTAAVLTVADGQHGHAADLATLSTNWLLTVADAASAHLADGPALTVASVLAVADALHAHISDSLGLSTNWLLTVADATHGQAADNVLLDTSLATTLTAQDASHGHAADVLTLVTNWLLVVSDATHGHSADELTLSATGATSLILADAVHAHLADEFGLTTATTLAILEAIHAHAAEALVLFFSSFTQAQLDEILAYVEANMAVPTANEIAIAVWQMVLEGALTAEQMQRIMLAALAGKRSGLGTATEQYMGLDGTTPRVVFTPSDAAGNGTTAVDGA